jgi:CDP-diacylglycerol--serine O-phosphatidyltransferase
VRWSIGPFGAKDLFTLINLMGGVFGLSFIYDGRPDLAGAAVLAGYLLGDTLDGAVARLTHTSNRFGSEFDTATDHFVQAIVPAVIVFTIYANAGHKTLGVFLLAVVTTCATVRQALFTVARLSDPLMWCGLPRTVSGFASMAFVLSRFFFQRTDTSYVVGAVLVSAFSVMGLLPIPYMTHRGVRRMQGYVKVAILAFLVTPTIAFFVARAYTFDVLFIWTFGYAVLGWLPLTRDERHSFFVRYREWAADVSRS